MADLLFCGVVMGTIVTMLFNVLNEKATPFSTVGVLVITTVDALVFLFTKEGGIIHNISGIVFILLVAIGCAVCCISTVKNVVYILKS